MLEKCKAKDYQDVVDGQVNTDLICHVWAGNGFQEKTLQQLAGSITKQVQNLES